jgi:hypothetical protein
MQHCNPSGSVLWSHTYVRRIEATQAHPFSLDCLWEEDRSIAHQTIRKSGSLLGIPNMFFEPHQNSREAIRVLRVLSYHLYTAPVPQQQQSTSIMFRPYQRRSGIFHEKKQDLFPVSNRLRQKTWDHPVLFGTGRLYHLSTEDDTRLSMVLFHVRVGKVQDLIRRLKRSLLAVACHK